MKKTPYIIICFILASFSLFAQSEAIHYDVNPKYPRYATDIDKQMLSASVDNFRASQFPADPVVAVAEFQPMEGVMIAYPLGVPVSLVRELSLITNVKVIVNNGSDSVTARNYFSNNQVNMDNVQFWRIRHDSYWVRDYGPWYVIDGHDSVNVIDFVYNRPSRPNDDAALNYIVGYLGTSRYDMPMVHTGGNYMVDGYGTAASTMLVQQENPSQSDSSLKAMALNYLGIDNYMFLPDPLGEYIAHIDCWGKFLDVDKVLIGKVPETDPRYDNYESVAETFANSITPWGNHYQVYRVYANPNANQATPYTNSLIVNDHVFVPVTGNSHDNEAVAVYQNAMPGYTIVPIMRSTYTPWLSTDALHCRTHELADRGMLYIQHYPILGDKALSDDLTLSATIRPLSGSNLITDSLLVVYKINNSEWQSQNLVYSTNNNYTFDFNSLNLSSGDTVRYYIFAKDESGRREKHPYIGAPDPHIFSINTVSINDKIRADISVYPNPAKSSLFIKNNSNYSVEQIQIVDPQGRIVLVAGNNSQETMAVNVNSLSTGVYIVKIKLDGDIEVIKKFVKK